jgi:predicted TIM-barrel fold metal-dependent hydrolase
MKQQIVDCHAHIIDPARFPYENGPGYKPTADEVGTAEAYVAALDQSNIRFAVLVQPSCYGYNNSAVLDTMRRYPGRFKSIGMVPAAISDKELIALVAAGIIGIRFNLVSYDPDVFHRKETTGLLKRAKEIDWFVEVVADDAQWYHAADILNDSGVKILVDHFGMHAIASDVHQPGFKAVLELGHRNPNALVKLTTPFSLGLARPQHHLVQPFVQLLIEAFGAERCIWGSDWPFLAVEDPPNLPQAVAYLDQWVNDSKDRKKMLWENPLRLFAFEASPK